MISKANEITNFGMVDIEGKGQVVCNMNVND